MCEKMNAYRVSMGKPEQKTPLGRPKYKWEDNIRKSELGSMDCMHMAWDRDQ
jgi:hypothetical protein